MKNLFRSQRGFSHHFLLPVFVVIAVTAVGTYVLQRSRAATNPYDDTGQAALRKKEGPNKDFAGLSSVRLVKKDANHPCRGMFEIAKQDPKAPDLCTHGADASPAGSVKGKVYSQQEIAARANGIKITTEQEVASGVAAGTFSYRNIHAATLPKCYGNGTDGQRVQLVYAYHTKDNYSAYAGYIRLFAGAADTVVLASSLYSGTGSSARRIRFDQDPKTCAATVWKVYMRNYNRSIDNISNFVNAVPLTAFNTSRKYLVYVDEPNNWTGCGLGTSPGDSNPNPFTNKSNTSVGYATLPPECWNANDTHELFHTLGAVSINAPHTTGFGHCRDGYDVMCYNDGGFWPAGGDFWAGHESCPDPNAHWILDCNKDDYFSTSTSIPRSNYLSNHWNTANSPWLGR